jgi:hypothetical protein
MPSGERRIIYVRQSFAIVISTMLAVSTLACAQRSAHAVRMALIARRKSFADALSDEVVACVRKHAARGTGQVIIAAELTPIGQVPSIRDLGSSSGNDAVVACVQAKLHNPRATPGPICQDSRSAAARAQRADLCISPNAADRGAVSSRIDQRVMVPARSPALTANSCKGALAHAARSAQRCLAEPGLWLGPQWVLNAAESRRL